MKNLIRRLFSREHRHAQKRADDEDAARIENAERDLAALRARGERAVGALRARNDRNHWSDAITEMITGVRS